MSLKDEIVKAIGAHGLWKGRLTMAIDSGKCDVDPAKASMDNQCDFGKWLYGPTLSAQDKSSPEYTQVRDLHAKFHAVTGKILQCVSTGKKDDCKSVMDTDFKNISNQLTNALMQWKGKLP